MFIILLVVAVVVIRVMSADERMRALRYAVELFHVLKAAVTRKVPEIDDFRAAMQTRTTRLADTPVLTGICVSIFVLMILGAGRLGDPQTLIAWGGNFGPRTTNGEWWRVATSIFVHSNVFVLVVNMGTLFQVGWTLERLVGRVVFAAAFVSAGILAGLTALSQNPIVVNVGAAGAICGLFGLLAAACVWMTFYRSLIVPGVLLRRLSIGAVVFFTINALGGASIRAMFVGFLTGLVGGVVLTRHVHEATPAVRRVAVALASATLLMVAFAAPLRGLADVRPEIVRLVAIEERTATAYQTAVDRFKKGRMSAEGLAQMIGHTIVPELQAADARLNTVGNVPAVDRPLMAGAREYVRLRTESWKLRAEGLRGAGTVPRRDSAAGDPGSNARWRGRAAAQYKAATATLARAEDAERASLQVLQRIAVTSADSARSASDSESASASLKTSAGTH